MVSFDFTGLLRELGLAFLIAILALVLSMADTHVGIELGKCTRVVLFAVGLVVIILSYLSTLRISWRNGQVSKGYSEWGKWFTFGANLLALILLIFMAIAAFVARY